MDDCRAWKIENIFNEDIGTTQYMRRKLSEMRSGFTIVDISEADKKFIKQLTIVSKLSSVGKFAVNKFKYLDDDLNRITTDISFWFETTSDRDAMWEQFIVPSNYRI